MKKMKWIGMTMMAVLMGMNLVSCSQENDAVLPEQQTEEYVTVNLGVTGEYLEWLESPLGTRVEEEGRDVIAIQVYALDENGTTTQYAMGEFLSLDNVNIKLLENQEYSFCVHILVDECHCSDDEIMDDGHPGCCRNIGSGFIYGECDIPMRDTGYEGDRYYGELSGYIPTENGVVSIETKRTVYGAHFIAEELTEGNLKINVRTNWFGNYYSVSLTPETPESDKIYTFSDTRQAWLGSEIWDSGTFTGTYENYYTTKRLTISWTKDDGLVLPLGEYDVTFKRNVKTTIRIKVKDQSDITNGIIITREEAAMTDDENEYVIEVEDGTITEVPVTTVP